MARTDPDTPRSPDNLDRLQNVLIIRERFPHSHEDNVINLLAAQCFDSQDLFNNLADIQISRPTIQPACAEFAAKGAPNLCRYTDCLAVRRRTIQSRASRN